MATRVIDDNKLQNIAVAIQSKDNGGQMTVEEMPGRIEAIPSGAPVVSNPALVLWDWEGTKLAAYSREDALALTELPAPDTLPPYAAADHELLVFQSWNWSLANIKAWVQAHAGETLNVGAIYTTTDGVDHNFWNNPRLGAATTISMQKRGTASIENGAFSGCYSLARVNLPSGVSSIGTNAFNNCASLTQINLPSGVSSIGTGAFNSCCSLTQINLPSGVSSIGSYAFYGCASLTQFNIPDKVTSIKANAFYNCRSITHINLPSGVSSIEANAFYNCVSLCDVLIESKPTLAHTNAFSNLPTNYRFYVQRADLPWFETETNWSTIYIQGHIVAIEDYIEYLESIGFNVDKYKGATA
jgi:hypothetical protein